MNFYHNFIENTNVDKYKILKQLTTLILTTVVFISLWSCHSSDNEDDPIQVPYQPKTYVPGDIFEHYLIFKGYDSGPLDDSVITANIVNVKKIELSESGVYDITGIEDFRDLEYLFISYNHISKIDLSNNKNMKILLAGTNPAVSVNLANGNNENYLQISTDATCIQVDDTVYSNTHWKDNYPDFFWIDSEAYFTLDCNE